MVATAGSGGRGFARRQRHPGRPVEGPPHRHCHAACRDRAALIAALDVGPRYFPARFLRSAWCWALPAHLSPSRCRWCPTGIRREHQGIALGLAGAGNSGTVFASLFAPALAVAFGWRNVLGLAALPLVAVFVLFLLRSRRTARHVRRARACGIMRGCCETATAGG